MNYDITIAGKVHQLELSRNQGHWQCRLDGRDIQIDAELPRPDVLSLLVEGSSYEIKRERVGNQPSLWVGVERYEIEVRDPRSLRERGARGVPGDGPQELIAPMPGKVVRLLLKEGAEVEAGQGVLVVEAMKMQNEIKSRKRGVVTKIAVAEGARVDAGDVLAVVE